MTDDAIPHDEIDQDDADGDDDGNLQRAKRDLIKLGLNQGFLTQAQIEEALPLEHMSKAEVEALRFTFDTMGIQVRPSITPTPNRACVLPEATPCAPKTK